MRDISIIGASARSQIERAREEFARSPAGDARVIVMHHNPVKGELSQRHGLKDTQAVLGAFAEIGVDLVLCGHDHQEAVHFIEHTKRGTVISTAGTISNRRAAAALVGEQHQHHVGDDIEVSTLVWSPTERTFIAGTGQVLRALTRLFTRPRAIRRSSASRSTSPRRATPRSCWRACARSGWRGSSAAG